MLPDPTVPASLLAVLGALRGCFTFPTFSTFSVLVTGLIANTGRGTVTGMLLGANLTRHWSHDRVHAFFSRASWDARTLGASLSHLVVRSLVPDGAVLTVAVDDTLFKRRGKKVFGAAWQHDGSATGRDGIGYGTCFVVLGIVVDLPFLTRPVCLPVAARLHRPKGEQTKVELAASMIRFFTTRLPASAVLYDLAPPPTGRRGRPRLKGERLGTPAELAATARFTPHTVTRYGRTETVFLATCTCLWYGSLHTRTLRVVLLRDDATDTGYDLALVTTDLTTPAPQLITRYARRWSIEVTFAEAREMLGVGQARNRTRTAVERTVPFGLYCYTITVVWYALHGHHPADTADRRERQPWYLTKTTPAFSDMTAKLRRTIIAARFMPIDAGQPTDTEIRVVQEAWAAGCADLK